MPGIEKRVAQASAKQPHPAASFPEKTKRLVLILALVLCAAALLLFGLRDDAGIRLTRSSAAGAETRTAALAPTEPAEPQGAASSEPAPTAYIVNENPNAEVQRFHRSDCPSVSQIREEYRAVFDGPREKLIEEGYVPCKRCDP